MSRYLTGTRAQCDTWSAALDADAGLPIRGVTVGGPDRIPLTPGPGWTINLCQPPLESNPALAVLEVPDDQLTRLGRGGTPAQAASVDVTTLPVPLRTLVYARQGRDANGVPIPLSVGGAAQAVAAQR